MFPCEAQRVARCGAERTLMSAAFEFDPAKPPLSFRRPSEARQEESAVGRHRPNSSAFFPTGKGTTFSRAVKPARQKNRLQPLRHALTCTLSWSQGSIRVPPRWTLTGYRFIG